MKPAYFFLLTGLSFGTAQAQTTFSFGPRLGTNLATGNFTDLDNLNANLGAGGSLPYTHSNGYIVGVQLGAAVNVGWGHWAFQPALLFTQKGLTQQLDASLSLPGSFSYQLHYEKTSRIHYLELPLNVVYSFGQEGQGFQLFAGPYVALGVGGRAAFKVQADYTDPTYGRRHDEQSPEVGISFGNQFDDNQNQSGPQARIRQFDAGFNLGAGYRRGPVQVQLGYGLGLTNVYPDYPASYQQPNATGQLRTVQLAATYFLDHWPAARK